MKMRVFILQSFKNETACQTLANLCTLNMHSFGEGWNVCSLFRSVFSGPITHPPSYVPKLYYSDTEASSLLIRTTAIPHQFTRDFSSTESNVNVVVARFSLHGEFLGISRLSDLVPCIEYASVRRISEKFGSNYKSSCELQVLDYVRNQGGNKMEFLEPYLQVTDEIKKIEHLYAIPVKVLNFERNREKLNMVCQ